MDILRTFNGRALDIGGGGSGVQTHHKSCVELDSDGENLYIAYLAPSRVEYLFWFKKCLFNELYSFYQVGYRDVNYDIPDTFGIKTDANIKWLNRAYSDNIAPLSTNSGGWVGGNHSWNNDNVTKTARTDNYTIEADGYALIPTEKRYCKQVTISVTNTIFDPSIPPQQGQDILSAVFSTETVIYTVEEASIEVSVRQQISSTTTNWLRTYYGMQSVFDGETQLITPNAQFSDWETATSQYVDMAKANYPHFNRFIERNAKGYQSAYVQPYKLGNHSKTNFNIFKRGNNKSYHVLVETTQNLIPAGSTIVWCGVYTFFKTPIVDNENVFAYCGVVNGKDTIFVWVKRAFTGSVPIPMRYQLHTIQDVEKDETITTDNVMVDADGVNISASAAGSWIFHV